MNTHQVSNFLAKLLYFSCIVTLLAGCKGTSNPSPAPAFTLEPIKSTATLAIQATPRPATPTSVPTPTFSPSLTPIPPPTTAELWQLYDPQDPNQPALITSGQDGYQLDPGWMPVRLEYLYYIWGIGDPAFDYHRIDLVDGAFQTSAGEVPLERVQALLAAVSRLQPVGSHLAGNAGTDDYPIWSLALTGPNGEQVMIESESTGSPGKAPWNVLDNGRLYAQYDGSLARPISDLFPGAQRNPANSEPDDRPGGDVVFRTDEYFAPLALGFTGLLPVLNSFYYFPDQQSGSIIGHFDGYEAIDAAGDLSLRSFTALPTVTLTMPNGPLVCETKPVESDTPYTWAFSCKTGAGEPGSRYHYPISITLGDSNGKQADFAGSLTGTWRAPGNSLFQPLSSELETALQKHPVAADLLTDHVAGRARYIAAYTQAGPLSGTSAGEVILLGQIQIAGHTLPYSVGTPYVLTNGSITRWDLGRPELEALLAEVAALPLTERILQATPDANLNLWFALDADWPEFPYLVEDELPYYRSKAQPCGEQAGWSLPNSGQPLRAFAFNHDWSRDYNGADFLLLPDGPAVEHLQLFSDGNGWEGISAVLLPHALQLSGVPPFEQIEILRSGVFGGSPAVLLVPREGVDRTLYEAAVNGLPGKLDPSYTSDGMLVEEVAFNWDEQGLLQPFDCRGGAATAASFEFSQVSPDGRWQFQSYPAGGDEKYGYAQVSGPEKTYTLRYDPKAYPYPKRASDGQPHPLYWSTDGRLLYYTLRPNFDDEPFQRIFYDGANLYMLNLENGKTEQVLKGGLMSVKISPDEEYIAYVKYDDAPIRLRVVPRTGGKEVSLSLTYDDINAGGIVWSPDSSQLLLAIDTINDNTSLLLATFKNKKLEEIRLIEEDARRLIPQEWVRLDRALLYDIVAGQSYWLVLEGAILAEGPQITPIP